MAQRPENTGKIGLHAVAERAGVGVATVDRVLNERGNVSGKTTLRVLEAARALGIRRILPETHRRLLRIEVILARPDLPLIGRMHQEFNRLAAGIDRSVVIQRTILADETPRLLSQALRATTCDAVVIYAQEHESIHAAIDRLHDRGVPVVTMISDLPQSARLAYAGTDHYRAGRTAGYFLSRTVHRPGPLLVLCNHLGFQSHAQRLRGLTSYLVERCPHLAVTEVLEGGDRLDLSEIRLIDAFRRHPGTVAVYNVGAANRAVAAAIRADLLATRPVFIGHELTVNTREMLRDGVMTLTIDQSPERQAQFAVDVLRHAFRLPGLGWMQVPYVSNVPFTLYGPENIAA